MSCPRVQRERAVGMGVEQREGGQQAALAGTGRADQIDDLAAIDVERQILEDGAV